MTGLAILPLPGFVAIASYLAGKISSITGPRLPMLIGLITAGIGFFLLLMIREHTPNYIMLIFPLAAIGFGTAFTMPAATIVAISAAPENRAGIAAGALNASRQVGSLIGVAVFGAIINSSKNFISGMHITLAIGGTIFFCGAVMTALFVQTSGYCEDNISV
jgi:DHA2 family methylenomycin A resistance protein-like MFS transporter